MSSRCICLVCLGSVNTARLRWDVRYCKSLQPKMLRFSSPALNERAVVMACMLLDQPPSITVPLKGVAILRSAEASFAPRQVSTTLAVREQTDTPYLLGAGKARQRASFICVRGCLAYSSESPTIVGFSSLGCISQQIAELGRKCLWTFT